MNSLTNVIRSLPGGLRRSDRCWGRSAGDAAVEIESVLSTADRPSHPRVDWCTEPAESRDRTAGLGRIALVLDVSVQYPRHPAHGCVERVSALIGGGAPVQASTRIEYAITVRPPPRPSPRKRGEGEYRSGPVSGGIAPLACRRAALNPRLQSATPLGLFSVRHSASPSAVADNDRGHSCGMIPDII